MKKKYFALEKEGQKAVLNIYDDISSWTDCNSSNLSKQLEELGDVNEIDVFISSYGGEVKEGLAIYNALKRHNAKIRTVCDGFACSIASVIFCAGDERVMNKASALMIHNAWTFASGNANELRKQADDLEKITQLSVEAYKEHSHLSEEDIKKMMDNETWILPEEAVEYGFATSIEETESDNVNQNAFAKLFELVKAYSDYQKDSMEAEAEDVEVVEEETAETEEETIEELPENEETENTDEETEEVGTDEEEQEEEKEDTAKQMWGSFFNALLKM